jgi:hypothetical protein
MKTILTMITAGLLFISTSCTKESAQDVQPAAQGSQVSNNDDGATPSAFSSSSLAGAAVYQSPATARPALPADQMLVYFMDRLMTVRFQRVDVIGTTPDPRASMDTQTNHTLYNFKVDGARMIPVIDAMPTSFNFEKGMLWNQVDIEFVMGVRPQQYTNAKLVFHDLMQDPSTLIAAPTRVVYALALIPEGHTAAASNTTR